MVDTIIFGVVGLVLLVFAVLVGGFGKIELLHDYHYKNVPDEDKKAYTRSIGGVLSVFALSCFSAVAVRVYTPSAWWVAVLFAGFAVSTFLLFRVQKKYNGGMFG